MGASFYPLNTTFQWGLNPALLAMRNRIEISNSSMRGGHWAKFGFEHTNAVCHWAKFGSLSFNAVRHWAKFGWPSFNAVGHWAKFGLNISMPSAIEQNLDYIFRWGWPLSKIWITYFDEVGHWAKFGLHISMRLGIEQNLDYIFRWGWPLSKIWISFLQCG